MTQYNILDIVELSNYSKLNLLYSKIRSLKKDPYEDNERIVFVYHPDSADKLYIVKELLDFVDIPDYFVIFSSDSTTLKFELDFIPTDIHCIYPWINLEISQSGKIAPCCTYKSSASDNSFIQKEKIVNVYNNSHWHKIRDQFRAGQFPAGCVICQKHEAVGLKSMRQDAKFKFKDIYYTIDYLQDDANNLQLLDLKLGNECNLSCRICDSKASSKIAEFNVRQGLLSKDSYLKIKDETKWAEDENFYNQLYQIAHNLKYLDIYGGEPLMIRRHYDFLRTLVDLDVAKNIEIDYNSNGTIYSDKFFDIWKNFKRVKISFSIDDIGDRFELQRNGAIWNSVQENIKKFINKKSDKFIIDVFTTVNIMNVMYLPELIQWESTQGFSNPLSVRLLHDPKFLSIENITLDAKMLLIEKFKKYIDYPVIEMMLKKIISITPAESNLDFLEYTKNLDRLRDQSFSATHIDMAKAMGL